MNTYKSLLPISNLYGASGQKSVEDMVYDYHTGKVGEVIAHIFCTNYQLFKLTSNKFFGLSQDDKDSFILEEIGKALDKYDTENESKAKLTTVITTYIYNRLRAETQALQKAARATLNLATSFEDLGEMDRIEEAGEEGSYSFVEMYELVNSLNLTENERKCCHLIILNSQEIKNAEIAELLGLSRAGVGHIKKCLKTKLAPVFEVTV